MPLFRTSSARRCARTTALALAAGTTFVGCDPRSRPVHVERAAIATGVGGAPAALYFTLRAEGTQGDSLVEIVADEAQVTSMQTTRPHRMPLSGSAAAMPMMPVGAVPVDARGTVRFAPGGYTGLLFGLRRALAPGDTVTVTVRLARGRSVSARVPVLVYSALEAALLTPEEARAVAALGEPTAAEGERLYRANGCATCHGAAGHGDGPVGRTLQPPPRDFRNAAAFKGARDADGIALTLAAGVPAGGSMPLYAHLTNHERASIARYVISLRHPNTD
jgi:copper(I)-binding protein